MRIQIQLPPRQRLAKPADIAKTLILQRPGLCKYQRKDVRVMMNRLSGCMLIVGGVLLFNQANAAELTKLHCAFKAEENPGGNLNWVYCAMTPERALAMPDRKPKHSDVCLMRSNAWQSNMINVEVDIQKENIKFSYEAKYSDFEKENIIKNYFPTYKTKEEAKKAANFLFRKEIESKIEFIQLSTRKIEYDEHYVSYDKPKEMDTYRIGFLGKELIYTKGVSEAVVVDFTGNEKLSWLELRFGTCTSE